MSLLHILASRPSVSEYNYTHYVEVKASAAANDTDEGATAWTNAQSIGTPCSIKTAMARATAGDVVGFRGGTYQTPAADRVSYEGYWMPTNSGTSGSPIVFAAYNSELPILSMDINDEDYLGFDPNLAQVLATNANQYITLDGFKCVALNNKTAGIFIGTGQSTPKLKGLIVQNCIVQCGSAGVTNRDNFDAVRLEDCDGAIFKNNQILDLTQDATAGRSPLNVSALKLYDNINCIVENNNILNCNCGITSKRNWEDGIIRYNWVDGSPFEAVIVLVTTTASPAGTNDGSSTYHNLITNCDYMGIDYQADGDVGATYYSNDCQFYNNTIYCPTASFSMHLDNTKTIDVYNNIIINDSNTQLRFADQTTITTCDHNQFGSSSFNIRKIDPVDNTYTSLATWQSSGELISGDPGTDSLASDPVFVNGSGNLDQIADFALDTGSPCIGAGRSSADMGCDITMVGVQ